MLKCDRELTGKDWPAAISARFVNLCKSVFFGFGCSHSFRGIEYSEAMLNLQSKLGRLRRVFETMSQVVGIDAIILNVVQTLYPSTRPVGGRRAGSNTLGFPQYGRLHGVWLQTYTSSRTADHVDRCFRLGQDNASTRIFLRG